MFNLLLTLLCSASADYRGLGEIEELKEQRRFERALEKLERLLPQSQGQQLDRLLLLQGELLVQLRRREEAETVIKRIDPREAPARFFRVRGQWQLLDQHPELARKDFVQALRSDPDSAERIRILVAQILLECEQKNFEEADKIWAQALLQAEEMSASPWLLLELFDSRFTALKLAGRRHDALSECRSARILFKEKNFREGVADTWIGEAEILHLLKDLPGAEKAALRAVELSPDRATALLFWGYTNVWEKHPSEHYRKIIALADQTWNDDWSDFEKLHVRLLQALLYFFSLREYEPALVRLQQAEALAGRISRPSSGSSTILLSFNQFSDGTTSDMEKVLWLQLACLQELGREPSVISSFMEEKLDKLPVSEQAPWLYKLGQKKIESDPEKAVELFRHALSLATPSVRPKMLRAVTGIYRRSGREAQALKTEAELLKELPSLSAQELAEMERFELYQVIHASHRDWLWSAWRSEAFTAQPSALLEYLSADNETAARLKNYKLQKFEEAQRLGHHSLVENYYTLRGILLLYQGRMAEALALIQEAGQAAERGNLQSSSYRRLESLILSILGDQNEALNKIRTGGRGSSDASQNIRTLIQESTALLRSGRYAEALDILPPNQEETPSEDYLYQAAYEGARVQALMGLSQWEEALAECKRLRQKYPDPGVQMQAGLLEARMLQKSGLREQAVERLADELERARALGSPFIATIVRVWAEVAPSTAPLTATSEYLETLLASSPPTLARKHRLHKDVDYLLAEEEVAERPLSAKDFVGQWNLLLRSHPQLEVSVPILPSAFVQQAKGLPPETTLVQYYTGPQTTVLMAAANGEDFYLRTIGVGQPEIEALISRLKSGEPGAADLLGRLLVSPVLELTAPRNLILSTHGPLQSLSWDLLEVEGKPLPASLSWQHWVASGLGLKADFQSANVLALGGVVDAKLPGASREVEFVKQLAPDRVTLLQGESAEGRQLRMEVPGKDIIIIASHSDPDGLILSDGVLALSQIYGLPIKPGALVVLSGCESGSIGQARRSPVSLATAFLDAGAGAVLATLDRVDDSQAEALVTSFYQYLSLGNDPRQSLRLAKLDAIAADRGQDWVKFVLFGRP